MCGLIPVLFSKCILNFCQKPKLEDAGVVNYLSSSAVDAGTWPPLFVESPTLYLLAADISTNFQSFYERSHLTSSPLDLNRFRSTILVQSSASGSFQNRYIILFVHYFSLCMDVDT